MLEPPPQGDRSMVVLVVTCVFAGVATVFVILRLTSKFLIVRKVSLDDPFIVLAWIFVTLLSISVALGATVGLGTLDIYISPADQVYLKRCAYAFFCLYNPAMLATKNAILILYWRLTETQPGFRYAIIAVSAVVNVAGLVLMFLNIFQCRPVYAGYTLLAKIPDSVSVQCLNIFSLYLSSAPINVITDLAILLLPIPMITSMRLESRAKVGIIIAFATGIFVTVIDVVRIAYLQQALIQEERQQGYDNAATRGVRNFAWHAGYSLMFSAVECAVGLICACALAIKPIVVKLVPSRRRPRRSAMPSDLPGELPRGMPEGPLPGGGLTGCNPLGAAARRSDKWANHQASSTTSAELDTVRDHAPATELLDITEACREGPTSTPRDTVDKSDENRRRSTKGSFSIFSIITRRSSVYASPVDEPHLSSQFTDFVQTGARKPLMHLTRREAWWPILFVSTAFLTWGISYGLLTSLTSKIQALARFSSTQTIAIRSAYWTGYGLAPGVLGYYLLTRFGFKATFMSGLGMYAIGSLAFWPSSILLSVGGFFISNLIGASGLALLEVAANPYIALAGPDNLMEARLNFTQGIQALGSLVSLVIAEHVLFNSVDRDSLFDTQWIYLAVALWATVLSVLFYYVPLSEATSQDLEAVAETRQFLGKVGPDWRVCKIKVIWLSSVLGILVMWLYVGAQEELSFLWRKLFGVMWGSDNTQHIANFNGINLTCFAVGRFIASFACYLGAPGHIVLATALAGTVIFTSAMTFLPLPESSRAAVTMLFLTSACEGPVFPTLFAMTIRGCGRYTILVSTGLTTAISGGAVWPNIAWAVDQRHPGNPRFSNRILIALYATMFLIILAMGVHPTIRSWLTAVDRSVLGQPAGSRTQSRRQSVVHWHSEHPLREASGPFITGLQLIDEEKVDRPAPPVPVAAEAEPALPAVAYRVPTRRRSLSPMGTRERERPTGTDAEVWSIG